MANLIKFLIPILVFLTHIKMKRSSSEFNQSEKLYSNNKKPKSDLLPYQSPINNSQVKKTIQYSIYNTCSVYKKNYFIFKSSRTRKSSYLSHLSTQSWPALSATLATTPKLAYLSRSQPTTAFRRPAQPAYLNSLFFKYPRSFTLNVASAAGSIKSRWTAWTPTPIIKPSSTCLTLAPSKSALKNLNQRLTQLLGWRTALIRSVLN